MLADGDLRACAVTVVVRYRPMRGGQMTPPDVVVQGRDDGMTARMAWNQASLSMPSVSANSQSNCYE